MKHKIDVCIELVQDLIAHGYTDPDEIMQLISKAHYILKQGDGLIWSQIETIIKENLW